MDGIRQDVEAFREEEVQTPEFARVSAGKEIGHRIADMVDETTTGHLRQTGKNEVLHQKKADGSDASRSMETLGLARMGSSIP
jgi:hypothetical protein